MRRSLCLVLVLIPVALIPVGIGCGIPQGDPALDESAPAPDAAVTRERLHEALHEFAFRYSVQIQSAGDTILWQSTDRSVRRRTVLWKLYAGQCVRGAAFQHDELAALLDTWSLCVQMRAFFESGEGSDSFGEHTGIALESARTLEEDIGRIAAAVLPAHRFSEARDSVVSFAKAHPIRWPFARQSNHSLLASAGSDQSLSWVFDASLAPLRAIGGMDHTAKAIHEVADVADEMTMVARYLPEQVRLEMQLLMYDLEDRGAVQSALENFEKISASAERLSRTAETLPQQLRQEVTAALDDVAKHQKELRETLGDLDATLKSMDGTLQGVERAAKNLAQAGTSWEGTVRAVHTMVRDFRGDDEPGGGEDGGGPDAAVRPAVAESSESPEKKGEADGRSFDILDYGTAAEEIGKAAVELQEASAEIRQLLATDTPAIERAREQIGSLASRITGLGVLLIVAFFCTLLVYRIAVARFVFQSTPPSEGAKNP